MKPGSRDEKLHILIAGDELRELKRHSGSMVEAFGLDRRIERYQGKRPIGLYRWDLDCLIDVIYLALDDNDEYPSKDSSEYLSLSRLHQRLQKEYAKMFD
ncbi:hypothetical protein ES703_38481 [subsurface metagenome]